MKAKKSYEISLFVVICIFCNCIGKALSGIFVLPFWLDSVGTVLAAYVLGPVCGAVVGATVNIIFSLHSATDLFYGLTSIAVGITVGLCARKGFLNSIFGTASTAFAVAILSTAISTPLNYIFVEGSTGNAWGDGVIELLQEIGFNGGLSHIIGEFYLDFLDKMITMLLLFWAVQVFRRKNGRGKKRSKRSTKAAAGILLIMLQVCAFLLPAGMVLAKEATDDYEISSNRYQGYIQTIYNGKNGLPGGIASDIVQTKDGVLWIGTHNGLYRYSGTDFEWMNQLESVKTVNCLYTDEDGRLWIGTNDNGLSICINQKISNVVNREAGLPSNSVRCIVESSDGYYYVGTTESLGIMTLSSGLKVCDTISDIQGANSLCADRNGNVAAVSDEGELYVIHGLEITNKQILPKAGEVFVCCAYDEEGNLYVGTSGGTVVIYHLSDGKLQRQSSIECGDLERINSLSFSEAGILLVCADNGAGYFSRKDGFCSIETNHFDDAIEHILIDYQENMWLASSRLGLLRLCPSAFSGIYGEEEKPGSTVNAVVQWRNCLYIGTEEGLDIGNGSHATQMTDSLMQKFHRVGINCLLVDSKNSLWIGTFDRGIFEVAADGEIRNYDRKTGALGNNFHALVETKAGLIAAAGDSGVTFIKDGEISYTVNTAKLLGNPAVNCLYERADGSILAGTDGSGIVIMNEDKITRVLKQEDGLSSEVILKMTPDSEGGLFIVTGNSLCYVDSKKQIRILDDFPYYDNYDLVVGKHGELFVLSSAGIYVVEREELLRDGETKNELKYDLLDSKKGLWTDLTPNAWNYIDNKGNLYLPGTMGVVSIDLNRYDITARSYRMLLDRIVVDGEIYSVEKGEVTGIPRGADRIEIIPEVINYSINDPDISVYLEGFDKEPKVMPYSELTSVVYTNLPSGEYTFHLAVLDNKTGSVDAANTYQIMKEKEMYDNWWFILYMGVEAALIISYLTWLFVRTQIQKTLRIQKMEVEWARHQLQMGNETILTIAQAVDAKDERTSQHSLRVSEYSVMIAKKLGYNDEECENLRKIAMLHDIGKIGIPDRVLNKPERLTDEEYEIMKSHVARGAEILKNFTLIDHVADGALYHHERYDGRGYGQGLKGREIPLNARIIGIADAFDAMTANRVYRKKLDLGYVVEELKKGSGTQFDPKLVEIMLGLIEDGTIDIEQIYKPESGAD